VVIKTFIRGPNVFTGKNSLSEFEETVDLNKEFATSTVIEVGRHPFAQMEENPDMHRKSNLYGHYLLYTVIS
jgi:hypothetical protein